MVMMWALRFWFTASTTQARVVDSVISQQLLHTTSGGLVPAFEIMHLNNAVRRVQVLVDCETVVGHCAVPPFLLVNRYSRHGIKGSTGRED